MNNGNEDKYGNRQLSYVDYDELHGFMDVVMSEHPDKLELYSCGDADTVRMFIGAVMRMSKGHFNPEIVRQEFDKRLL